MADAPKKSSDFNVWQKVKEWWDKDAESTNEMYKRVGEGVSARTDEEKRKAFVKGFTGR